MKRKSAKKLEQSRKEQKETCECCKTMPLQAFLVKGLSVFLSVLLVIALTLYVIGKMPARGFWTFAVLLAVIAFFVLPAMRKKFCCS